MQNIYIALGSNMGDRLANLQQAVNRIDNEIGQVSRCSSVHEVPAVGFSGPIFLNACLVWYCMINPQRLNLLVK